MVTGGLRFLENLHKHLFILWNLCDSHSSFHSRHRRCFCSCVLASLAHIDVCCSCTQSLHLCLFFTPAEKSIPLFLLRPWLTPVESTVSLTVHYIRKSNVSDLKGSWPTLPTKKRKKKKHPTADTTTEHHFVRLITQFDLRTQFLPDCAFIS